MGQDKNNCDKTLAVIGEGMASLIFLYDLAQFKQKNLTLPFSKILWISAGTLSPGCSLFSTALVARHGVRQGLSPLGDDLFSAYQLATEFYHQWDGPGVQKTLLTYFEDEKQSVQRRFGVESISTQSFGKLHSVGVQEEAYLINPETFLPALKEKILNTLPMIELVHDIVTEYDSQTKKLQGFIKEYFCHQVFWGIGASKFLPQKTPGKTISGHVLRYDQIDLGSDSFALNIFGKNIIYRKDSTGNVLFVGATTAADQELLPDTNTLYQQLTKVLQLPEFAGLKDLTPTIWGGPRHKQSKRRATMKSLNEQEFCAAGFYKSGYSLAFLSAQKARSWWH